MSTPLTKALDARGVNLQHGVAQATEISAGEIVYLDTTGKLKVLSGVAQRPIGVAEYGSVSGSTEDTVVNMFDGAREFQGTLVATTASVAGEPVMSAGTESYLIKVVASDDLHKHIGIVSKNRATAATAVNFIGGRNDALFTDTILTTLGGSGTTTDLTFSSLGMPNAVDASYSVQITDHAAITTGTHITIQTASYLQVTHGTDAAHAITLTRYALKAQS
jgi:hypothetical protein